MAFINATRSPTPTPVPVVGGNIVRSTKAVVASDDARGSEVGVKILRQGGHAVDAAIATALCVGVVNPTESGIGGGAFMVVHEGATSKAVAFDMRETAPAAARENMYEHHPEAQIKGPLSVAVPGELRGLHEAWKAYGRLPWKTLFQPAISYAKNGFEVYPYLAQDLKNCEDAVIKDPGLKQIFAPNGRVLQSGETCYNKKLAESLEAVANEGPDVFYNGRLGQNLINDLKGGILTMKDLQNYKAKTTKVLEVDLINGNNGYNGFKIQGMPPPSSGTVGLAFVANVLSYYGKPTALEGDLGSHRMVEALKHMLGMRMNLGDPAYEPDVSKYVKEMTSASFAEKIWRKIYDNKTFPPEYYEDSWKQILDAGTCHLGVVDQDRNAVALTASVNDIFGAKILSPSTGIVFNNTMRDFSTPRELDRPAYLPPAKSNLIAPGKRPLSSMTPVIILKDGQLAGVLGGSGGVNIIAAVSQVFLHYFVCGMNPLPAIQHPRLFPKLAHCDLRFEDKTIFGHYYDVAKQKREFLRERGHKLFIQGFEPASHLIVQTPLLQTQGLQTQGLLTAVCDRRKDANPAALQPAAY